MPLVLFLGLGVMLSVFQDRFKKANLALAAALSEGRRAERQVRALKGDVLNPSLAVNRKRDIRGGCDQHGRDIRLEIAKRFLWSPESLHERTHPPTAEPSCGEFRPGKAFSRSGYRPSVSRLTTFWACKVS